MMVAVFKVKVGREVKDKALLADIAFVLGWIVCDRHTCLYMQSARATGETSNF